jgi:cytochrome bd-type quinol oxidase subunit 2
MITVWIENADSEMNIVAYFFWLAAQALQFPLLFPPVMILMVVGIIGTASSTPFALPNRWRQDAASLLIPAVVPISILLCGTLFMHDTELDEVAPRWPENLIIGLLLTHIPLVALLVWRLRGARWLAFCASLMIASYSCGAAFMSIMAVSGRWL